MTSFFKRLCAALLTLTLLCALLPQTVLLAGAADDSGTCGENLTWTLDAEGLLTISGTGAMIDYGNWRPWQSYLGSIKGIMIGNGVTSIGDRAFTDCSVLTSIAIPDSVTSIGNEAFSGCSGLTSISVSGKNPSYDSRSNCNGIIETSTNTLIAGCKNTTFPDSVTSIGDYAFGDCSGLTSITIPDSVTSIGLHAFNGCAGLTSVTIPDSVTSIGWFAFSNCSGLTTADIRARITELPRMIFGNCSALTSVTLPDCLTAIGVGAFNKCTNLTDITFPQSLTTIGTGAFFGCNSLTDITIPNGVTSLDFGAFAYCSALRHAALPSTLQQIGTGAFRDCTALADIEIPENVTSIGGLAFLNCTALERVTLPKSTTSIPGGVFAGCTALTAIQVEPGNPSYVSDASGVLFNYEKTELVQYPAGRSGVYAVPDGVIRIGRLAFHGCSKTEAIILPKSVTQLGEFSFANCSGGWKLYFLGDAPQTEEHIFNLFYYYMDYASAGPGYEAELSDLTVCYTEGSAGWTAPTWNGCPTAVWDGVSIPHTHSYTTVVTAPTCTEQGYTTHTCACGDSYTDSYVDALKHDMIVDEAVAATCTETGLTEGSHCSRCDYKVAQKAVDALGHAWDDGKVTTAPTAENEGVKTFTCTRCGATKNESIAKLPSVTVNFTDVKKDAYYAAPVSWAVAMNVTNGVSETSFAPDDTCTRGQIVTFLWRAAGKPTPTGTKNPFTDVSESDYYYNAVLWAVENNITAGTGATTFSPNDGCTRGQVATFLWRYEGKPAAKAGNPFVDVKQGAYYYDAVLWAAENGITNGTSATTFEPDATCTRGQIVTFLYRDIAK